MGDCSGQIIRADLKQSLAKAGSFAIVGAASALVGAMTSRAVNRH
jgi:hypothetical protein